MISNLPLRKKIIYSFISFLLLGACFKLFLFINEQAYFGEALILGLRTGMSKEVVESTISSKLESREDIKKSMRERSMETENFGINKSPQVITKIGDTLIPPSISARISEYYAVNIFLNHDVLMTFNFFDEQLFGVRVLSGRTLSNEEFLKTAAELDKKIKDSHKEITKIQDDPSLRMWDWVGKQVKSVAYICKGQGVDAIFLQSENENFVLSSRAFKSMSSNNSL